MKKQPQMRRLGLRRQHQLRREATSDGEATEEEETTLNEEAAPPEESILNEEAESSGVAPVIPAADPASSPAAPPTNLCLSVGEMAPSAAQEAQLFIEGVESHSNNIPLSSLEKK